MVFSSLPFLFFLFPAVLLLCFIGRSRRWRNGVLLCASLIFYAWSEPKFLPLMVLASTAAYAGGLLMNRLRENGRPQAERAVFAATVVLLLGNLFVFKYLDFAVGNLNALPGVELPLPGIVLPVGISFYTFQILSYVIDLHRGKVAVQRSWFSLLLYVAFFPQLIAGPIVRYQTVEREILERRENLADAAEGFRRLIVGMGKKVLLANRLALIAETVYNGDGGVYGTGAYWMAALAYALQIYFDFSGYSDMAIGLGRIFGFHFLENFDHPYVSRSVTEFWRRWHISLSSWFRDYVYIPLGGNRVSRGRWVLNILIVWGLTGFWHGASWNFLLWGFYYALLLLGERLLWGRALDKLPRPLQWLYTMFLAILGWVLFNRTDFGQLLFALRSMFFFRPTDWLGADMGVLRAALYLPLGLFLSMPAVSGWGERLRRRPGGLALSYGLHLLLAGACVVVLISSKYNPFIYFRF